MGSIIGRIAKCFYEKGARLIIHVANVGSCREPEDIGLLFIPMFFSKIEQDGISFIPSPYNPLLEMYPTHNSGIHTCVNTILEETYKPFREIVTRLGITSVDMEAFHIVEALQKIKTRRKLGFSGVYIATDYVRKEKEKNLELPCDLTTKNMKRKLVHERLDRYIPLVSQYLQNLTDTPRVL